MPKEKKKKQSKIPPYKTLRDYSAEELRIFLDNNEDVELQWLAAICSEILRRQSVAKPQTSAGPSTFLPPSVETQGSTSRAYDPQDSS